MKELLGEIKRRNSVLYYLGAGNFLLFFVMLIILPFDYHHASGSHLIQSMKFAFSFGIYLWTMGWFLEYLKIPQYKKAFLGRLIAFFILLDITAIILKNMPSTPFHFHNFDTINEAIYKKTLFTFANVLIVANTLVIVYIMYLFFKKTVPLSTSYLWGIRLGFVLFILASLEGAFILFFKTHFIHNAFGADPPPISHLRQTNISLTLAHFLGIHALQALPFFGYLVKNKSRGTSAVFLSATLYLATVTALFLAALRWIPFY